MAQEMRLTGEREVRVQDVAIVGLYMVIGCTTDGLVNSEEDDHLQKLLPSCPNQ
jgi:hypothetical protein